jgi:hypothetical protein
MFNISESSRREAGSTGHILHYIAGLNSTTCLLDIQYASPSPLRLDLIACEGPSWTERRPPPNGRMQNVPSIWSMSYVPDGESGPGGDVSGLR